MAQKFSNTSTGDAPVDPYKHANLDIKASSAEKIEDLAKFITACKFGMMTTRTHDSPHLVSRCMALAAKENGGIDLLFHTNTESGKTDDLAADPHVNVAFINSTGEWASISGTASVITDRSLVKQHYSPELKAWLGDLGDGKHDGGEDDPRIGIIRVTTNTAVYSLTSKNFISRAAEVAKGVVTGQAASINKLREISETEVRAWRSTH